MSHATEAIRRVGVRALLLPLLAGCLVWGSACASTPRGPTPEEVAQAEREADNRKAQAHYKIGIEYLRDGNPALAIRELQTALRYDPDDAWSHLSIAEAYRLKGRPKMAQDALERALELKPDFQQARLNLSALMIQRGDYEGALVHADALLDDPTFPVPWKALTNKGYAQLKLGRVEEARQSLLLAVEYNPEYWQAHLNLGILESGAGRPKEALGYFEWVLSVRPGALAESEVNYRMGEIYVTLGNRARAMDHLVAASSRSGPWGKRSEETLKRLQ